MPKSKNSQCCLLVITSGIVVLWAGPTFGWTGNSLVMAAKQ
jgi:hypothetical protein